MQDLLQKQEYPPTPPPSEPRDRKTEYRLLLFLAADMQNSTAIKYRFSRNKMPEWKKMLRNFHEGLIRNFVEEINLLSASRRRDQPRVWKALGDEIILTVNPGDLPNLKHYLAAFGKAVKAYNAELAQSDQQIFSPAGEVLRLRLKPRAWLADFPLNNLEMVIPDGILDPTRPERPWANETIDFAGKAIDTGFRLGAFATSRKFVLSAEVVWALACDPEEKLFPLFHEGSAPLKGVLGGDSYPIFWWDLKSGDTPEDLWIGRTPIPPSSNPLLRTFCEKFIGMDCDPLLRPYFTEPPSQVTEAIHRLQEGY
ncbi:hypothetical protein SIID45300_00413 [Candidatus Magnetaquicoccaceae bacterium FCR-1]|uniref:Adenylate cyclase n=2 Tax=Candidatus Magnetaquiglobus chichijimensis TaxID=3141448 RepID=A0ABQ0C5E5_9PROT